MIIIIFKVGPERVQTFSLPVRDKKDGLGHLFCCQKT